jgi:hypothetical protein
VTITLDQDTPRSSLELISGKAVEWQDEKASLTLDAEDVAVIRIE